MDPDDLRRRYAALPVFPEFPGEREWPQRLQPFEAFLANAAAVADHTREHLSGRAEELHRLEAMFPELWDLLFEAFPPRPPR